MVTGHSDLQRVQEARDSGVNKFMAKPVAAKDILKRLEVIVGHPRPFVDKTAISARTGGAKTRDLFRERRTGSPPAAANEDELSTEEALGELGVGTMSNAAIA